MRKPLITIAVSSVLVVGCATNSVFDVGTPAGQGLSSNNVSNEQVLSIVKRMDARIALLQDGLNQLRADRDALTQTMQRAGFNPGLSAPAGYATGATHQSQYNQGLQQVSRPAGPPLRRDRVVVVKSSLESDDDIYLDETDPGPYAEDGVVGAPVREARAEKPVTHVAAFAELDDYEEEPKKRYQRPPSLEELEAEMMEEERQKRSLLAGRSAPKVHVGTATPPLINPIQQARVSHASLKRQSYQSAPPQTEKRAATKPLYKVLFDVQSKRESKTLTAFLREHGVKDYYATKHRGQHQIFVGAFSSSKLAEQRRAKIEGIVGISPVIRRALK